MTNPSYSEVERKIRFPLSAMNPTICTQSKTKGLFAKRKPPIAKRKPGNRFVMHLPGTVGAFSLCGFEVEIASVIAETAANWKTAK